MAFNWECFTNATAFYAPQYPLNWMKHKHKYSSGESKEGKEWFMYR